MKDMSDHNSRAHKILDYSEEKEGGEENEQQEEEEEEMAVVGLPGHKVRRSARAGSRPLASAPS
jgi:hypothetical protein